MFDFLNLKIEPIRKFSEIEKSWGLDLPFSSIAIKNYSYQEFYKKADSDYDIFRIIIGNKELLVVPCENYLMNLPFYFLTPQKKKTRIKKNTSIGDVYFLKYN